MKYVIDTHALIWFLQDDSRLGENADFILSNADSQLVLPAIVVAEAVWIIERGRTSIPSARTLLNVLQSDSRFVIHPLTESVIEKTIHLTAINEMHDRQIVATALVLQERGEAVALLTCDQNISESQLVQIAW